MKDNEIKPFHKFHGFVMPPSDAARTTSDWPVA